MTSDSEKYYPTNFMPLDAAAAGEESISDSLTAPGSSSPLAIIPAEAQGLLMRMFTDPNLLEKPERTELVAQLRACVRARPDVAELRVLFGMALCVNLDVPDAIEELKESVRLDPDSYIAQLKMGELWMRLRVITKAEDHTRHAAMLAQNLAQAEEARKQAATIRTMRRDGIERGGFRRSSWLSFSRLRRLFTKNRDEEALATVDMG
jgi:hypothetical protein